MTHRSVAPILRVQAQQETVFSRQILKERLGEPVSAAAYPFRTRADFNNSTASLVQDAGYACTFASQHGVIPAGSDAYSLPSVKVEGGKGLWLFRRITRGGLDAWRWIDRALRRIQANGHG